MPLDLIVLTTVPRGRISRAYRSLEDFVRGRPNGTSPVTRSLLAGLSKQDAVSWSHIENYTGQRATTIHVVHNPRAARVAIEAKRKGLCDRLIVGPAIVVDVHDSDNILLSQEIDAVIVASDLVRDIFEAAEPLLVGRVQVWPAGVDPEYWKPAAAERRKVLIYDKRRPVDSDAIDGFLRSAGLDTIVLRYGSYALSDYKAALNEAFACVVLGGSESQGIALAEAWAMNVPTFVSRYDFDKATQTRCSAAPNLTDQTGAFWDDEDQLASLLTDVSRYRPRQWIMENGTDRLSAEALIRIALPRAKAGQIDPQHPGEA